MRRRSFYASASHDLFDPLRAWNAMVNSSAFECASENADTSASVTSFVMVGT